MLHLNRSIPVVPAILVLSGCGGGGGPSAPVVDPAEITSANAPAIASAVMAVSLEGGDLGAFAGLAPSAAPQTSPKTSAKSALVYSKIGEIQSSEIEALRKQSQTGILQAEFGPEGSTCTGGGMVTISGNLQDPNTLTRDDMIVFDFDMCVEGGQTVDGLFAMTITSFSGDFMSTFSFGVRVELTAFTITADSLSATANGDITMTIDATASPMLTTTVNSDSLTVTDGSASHTLSGYDLTEIVDGASGNFSFETSGTLSSSVFSGAVTFETEVLLQGMGDGFAFMGKVVITGADGATIAVIVLDGTFVRLEVDLDGDGTPDETVDTTWTELLQG